MKNAATSENFFLSTYAVWKEVELEAFDFENTDFVSDSGSRYIYTKEGVLRFSDHWNKVASCLWPIESLGEWTRKVGFCKWEDFVQIDGNLTYCRVDELEGEKVVCIHGNIAWIAA